MVCSPLAKHCISLTKVRLVFTRVTFLKNVAQIKNVQIEHKIPIENSVFPGGWGFDNFIYIVYDYTTTGHTDL